MPYDSAYEVLKDLTSTTSECTDAIEELGIQYGYILCTVSFGIRKDADAEADLVRIKVLIAALKFRIAELTKH